MSEELKPWQKATPVYGCCGCCFERSWPAGDLRIFEDGLWCADCYEYEFENIATEWSDLPQFKPVPEIEVALYEELYDAARQLLRYNGVDKDRATAAGMRLTAATHAITEAKETTGDNEND